MQIVMDGFNGRNGLDDLKCPPQGAARFLVAAEWVDGSDHEPYYYGKHLNILRKLLTHKEQMATNVRYEEMLQTSI